MLFQTVLLALAADARAPQEGTDPRPPALEALESGPIRWRPWGEEAIALARREDRPILLVSTYFGCDWCDRMATDALGDEELAALLEAEFVCVAIDRERHPLVDQHYLATLALITGDGGWPVTAFIDPQTLNAFYVGTWFPAQDDVERGVPSLRRVVETLAAKWRDDREPLVQFARGMTAALPELLVPEAGEGLPGGLVDGTVAALLDDYDPIQGGFGEGPRFPWPERLEFLFEAGGERGRAAVRHTLLAIARGALRDPIDGGIRRQCLDPAWNLPVFEKPPHLQGRMASLFARVGRALDEPELLAVAREIADYLVERLIDPRGLLLGGEHGGSGDDAGAHGTWTRDELREAVGEELEQHAAERFGFDLPPVIGAPEPRWVLRRPAPLPGGLLVDGDGGDADRGEADEATVNNGARDAELLARLRAHAAGRPRPRVDSSVIAAWCGVAAAGLAETGGALEAPELIEAAERMMERALRDLRDDEGRLHRTLLDGELGPPATAEDHAALLRGALALHAVTGLERWLETAVSLHDEGARRYEDGLGGWLDGAPSEHRRLPVIGKRVRDGELPGANAELLMAQVELGRRTEQPRFVAAAARTAALQAARLAEDPAGSARALLALRRFEAHFPDQVPLSRGPVVRVRDSLVGYELRSGTGGAPSSGDAVELELTLTVAGGYHFAAADPLVDGVRGLEIAIRGSESDPPTLEVSAPEPDHGRLAVAGAPLATHGDLTRFTLRLAPPSAVAGARLDLTLELWSEAGSTPPRTVTLDLSRFAR
jgi:uncharacterized protein YyaL (SSP411 family)